MENYTAYQNMFEIIQQNGLQGMDKAMTLLINEAMKIERSTHLGCQLYQRSEQRQDYRTTCKF